MKWDKRAIEGILAMDDAQLATVIRALAARSGVDLSGVNLSAADLAGLRAALRSASSEELARLAGQFGLSGELK